MRHDIDQNQAGRGLAARVVSLFAPSLLANHYPALHGLRSLAVLSVLNVHVAKGVLLSGYMPDSDLPELFEQMFFGMDLFFMLSGFLIGTMLLKSVEEKGGGIGRFYLRRSLRIFPLYYVVLTAFAVLLPLTPIKRDNLIWEYLYLTNYGDAAPHTRVMLWGWSLCVEEHFYLAVPLFLMGLNLLSTHRARIGVLLFLWLAGLGVRLGVYFGHEGPWVQGEMLQKIYFPTHTRFDILVAGVLLAYVHHHFHDRIRQLLGRPLVRIAAWVLIVACLALLAFRLRIFGLSGVFKILSWGTFTSIMYAPLMLLALASGGLFARALSRRFFLYAATVGYGIYLVHIPVLYFLLPWSNLVVERFDPPIWIVWVGLLVGLALVSAVISYCLHLVVEKPIIFLRDRLAP